MLQLNPPIPLDTPKGPGLAYFLLDYGPDYDVVWGICVDSTGEWWWLGNDEVRGTKNVTMGRRAGTVVQKLQEQVNREFNRDAENAVNAMRWFDRLGPDVRAVPPSASR